MADVLAFEVNGRLMGFDTAAIECVVEAARVFFMPGSGGLVKGVISLRNEPVTVVDAFRTSPREAGSGREKGPSRIVIVRDRERILGFDIGSTKVYCLLGGVDPMGRKAELFNWAAFFDEARKVLAA